MDVGMKSRRSPALFLSMVLLAGGVFLLAACLVSTETSATDGTDVSGISPSSHNLRLTEAENTSLSTSLPLLTTRTTVPVPATVPTLSVCPNGALLYLYSYGLDEEGWPLYEVHWVCPDTSVAQLVGAGIRAIHMSASPDGRRVAFGGEMIQVMELPTREMRTFLDPIPGEAISYLSWSPDGEYIVYQRSRDTKDYSPLEVLHLSSGIVSRGFIPSEYEEQMTYATIVSAVWLPEGDQLLLYGNYTQNLYLLDVICDDTSHLCTATDLQELPMQRSIAQPPSVSPDGTKIATVCIVPKSNPIEKELCVLDFSGNVIREYNNSDLGVEHIYNPAWSPDGSRIAFDDIGTIYILSLSDQGITRLNLTGNQPVWLP